MAKELIWSRKQWNGKWVCIINLAPLGAPTSESIVVSGFRTRREARARCRELAAAIKREANRD